MMCSADDEISECHSVSKYLMRNSLVWDDSTCCWAASSAGIATLRGCSSISEIDWPKIWNFTKPRFFTAHDTAS